MTKTISQAPAATKQKRLIAYARVSTKLQEGNTSIPDQLDRIRKYCEAMDYELVGEESDVLSGSTTNRDGFQKAVDAVLVHDTADGIICCYLDRFGRNTLHFLEHVEKFNAAGKTLIFMDVMLDTSNYLGRGVCTILMAVATMLREQAQEKSKAARAYLKQQGLFYGGQAPFGFRAVPRMENGKSMNRLEPDEREQEVLSIVVQMDAEDFGPQDIANELNKMAEQNPKWKPRHQTYAGKPASGRWHCKQIQRILERIEG